MKTVLIGIGIVLVAAVVVLVLLASGFSRQVAGLEARLIAAPPGEVRDDLPEVVHAYALRGLAGGTPARGVRLAQAAEMRLQPGADWQGLAARQTIATTEPGFAWVAEQRRGPVTVVRVLDRYVGGEGRLEIRLLGAVRLGASDGPDAAVGEGLRYLAELPWAPDAILLNRAVAWEVTPDGVAASMQTAGGGAAVLFALDTAGDFVGVSAKGRPATMPDGSIAYLDWQGTLSGYIEIGGRRVPAQAEVGYVYPDGYESYFRGTVTGYEVVE